MLGSYKNGDVLENSFGMHSGAQHGGGALKGHRSILISASTKMRDINENVKEHSKKFDADLTCQEKMDVSHSDIADEQDLTCNESVANVSAEFEVHTKQRVREAMNDHGELVIDLESNLNQNNNKTEPTPAILRAVSLANAHSMIAMPAMVPPSLGTKKEVPVVTPPVSSTQKLTKKGTVPVREAVDPAKYVRLQDVDGVRYACSKCGNVYKWRKSLNKHWKEKHDGEIPVPPSGNFPVLNIPHLKGGPQYSTPKSSSTSGRTMISPSMLTPMGNITSTHLDKYIVDMGAQSGGRPVQSPYHPNTSSASVTPNSFSSRDLSKSDRFVSMFPGIDIPYHPAPNHSSFLQSTGMRLKTDISPVPLQNSQPRFPVFEKFPFDYPSKEKPTHVPVPPPAAHSHGLLKRHEVHDDESNDSMPLDLSKKGKPSNALDLSAPSTSGGKPLGSSDAPLDFSIRSAPGSERSTPVASLKDRDEYPDGNWMRSTSTPEIEVYQNLQCYKCPFVAKDKQSFEDHLEQHTRGQYPQCDQCKEHFSSNDELTQHFGLHHLHILKNIELYDEDHSNKSTSASEPRQLFQYLTKPRDATSERKCVVCGAKFPLQRDIARHFTHFHADLPNPYKKRPNEEEEDENEPWPKVAKFEKPYGSSEGKHGCSEGDLECDQCAFLARDPAEMSRHLLVHSFNRPHACTMCGFSSKSKDELSAHVWKYHPSHAEELALMATNGGATPVSASKNLNTNTDKSPGSNNNAADTSGSSVNSGEFGLDDVIIVTPNTTEVPLVRGRKSGKSGTTSSAEILLPYKCSVCEYRARWPSEITQHMKNHSDEKPFHCPRCTYKSKWKWDVVKHLKRCGGGTVKDVIDTSRLHRKSEGDSNSPPTQNVVKQLQFLSSSPKHSVLSNGPPNVTVMPGGSPRAMSGVESAGISSGVYSPTAVDMAAHSRSAPSPSNSTSSDHSSVRNPSSPGGSVKSRPGYNRGLVNQGVYHCTQCPFIGNSPAELKRHCRVHSDEKPFSCATCGYSSKWKCDLKKHIKTYEHVAAPRSDGLEMKQKRDSLRFMSSNMEDDLSSCSDDDLSYLDQRALSPEELPAPRPTLYKCEKCQYVTYKKNMLDGHMKIHGQSREKSGKLKCKQCDFEASDLPSFLQHKLTHSSQQVADVSEDNHGKSSEILKRSDKDGSPVRSRRKPMKYMSCSKCPYTCLKYTKLVMHEALHLPHSYATTPCEFCDYNVKNGALLIQHMKMHPEFDEWYNQNGDTLDEDLQQEAENIDMDEAEYMESQDDKSSDPVVKYSSKTGMKLMIGKSGSDLGFRCAKCPFMSDSRSTFESHSEHHGLGEKFECEQCDWSADTLHALYKHVREVHPQQLSLKDSPDSVDVIENRTESSRTARKKQRRPKTCSECGYITDNPVKMSQHRVKHMSDNGHHCHYCDETTLSSRDMHEHLYQVHNVKVEEDALGSPAHRENMTRAAEDQQDDVDSQREGHNAQTGSPSPDAMNLDVSDDPTSKQLTEIKGQKLYLIHHGNRKVFACSKCSYRTNNSSHCISHIQQHGSGRRYTCDYCDYSLDKLTQIFHHMKMCHANEMDTTDTEAEGPSKTKKSESGAHRSPKSLVKNGTNKCSPRNNSHMKMAQKSVNGSTLLKKVLPKRKSLNSKVKKNGLTRIIHHKCVHCSFSSRCKSTILRHRRLHLVPSRYRCKMCKYSATRQFLIHQHMQFHDNLATKGDPSVKNEEGNTINYHKNAKHEKMHQCTECPFSSNKLYELKKHKSMHGAAQKYRCDLCSYSVNRVNFLQQHKKLHTEKGKLHLKKIIVLKPVKCVSKSRENNDKMYKCGDCPYASNKHQSYASHIKLHGAEGRYPCSRCTYVVDRQNLLHQHSKLHVEDATTSPSQFNRDRFKCAKCPYHTHRETLLDVHYQMHTSQSRNSQGLSNFQYKCERCPYQTNSFKIFENHSLQHSVRSKFVCPYCDFSSQKAPQLGSHIRLHLPGRELDGSAVKAIISSANKSSDLSLEDFDLTREPAINNNNKNSLRDAICQFCERNFSSETEKEVHERQHMIGGSD